MMKKSPARSLSKGLSKAGLGMRRSTAAARTMGKPSQSRGLAGARAKQLNAFNKQQALNERRVAQNPRRAQKPKGPGGLTGISAKQRQQMDALKKIYAGAGVTQQARPTKQLTRSKGPGGLTRLTKATSPLVKATKNAYAGAVTKRRKV